MKAYTLLVSGSGRCGIFIPYADICTVECELGADAIEDSRTYMEIVPCPDVEFCAHMLEFDFSESRFFQT